MFFIDFVKKGPRNIRKRLFRDIILIIMGTVGAILVILFYQGTTVKDDISGQLINETSLLVKKRFTSYLTPFDTSLRILAEMDKKGLSHEADSTAVAHALSPFLAVHEDVKTISLVFDSGTYMQIHNGDGSSPEISQGIWAGQDTLLSQDFEAVMSNDSKDLIRWSESFTTTKGNPGLSASIDISEPGAVEPVILTYFIPAERIIEFIADIEIDQDIDIVLFNEQGLFRSRWNPYLDTKKEGTQREIPTQLSSKDVLALWEKSSEQQKTAQKVSLEGKTWWVGFTALNDSLTSSKIAVIFPESAFIDNVYKKWLELAALLGIILFSAILLTVNLVRRYSFQLKDLPHQNLSQATLQNTVRQLIDAGESSSLEFKSTMRRNLQTGKNGKEIEIAWLKAVTAFMNSDGGILLIGVSDDGNITGLEEDGFANDDKCRLHFKNLVNSHIGTEFSRYIHLKFCAFSDKTICVIECERVRRPVFLTLGKTEDFYIRSGPSSMKMSMSQMVAYLNER